MKTIFISLLLLVPFFLMGQSNSDVLSNATIIKLYKNGISQEIILSKIKTSKTNFNVSTDELIKLKELKIPDNIVNAMVDAMNTNNHSVNQTSLTQNASNESNSSTDNQVLQQIQDPGIYFIKSSNGSENLVQLNANVCSQVKTSIWALYLTSGIAKAKKMATLAGTKSQIQIANNSPIFYFYFGKEDNTKGNGDLSNTNSSITPNQYLLIKMDFNNKTKSRQFDIGSIGLISGVNSGVSEKYIMPFKSVKIKPGLFEVTSENPLTSGEYCFMYSGESNKSLKVFDFGISN